MEGGGGGERGEGKGAERNQGRRDSITSLSVQYLTSHASLSCTPPSFWEGASLPLKETVAALLLPLNLYKMNQTTNCLMVNYCVISPNGCLLESHLLHKTWSGCSPSEFPNHFLTPKNFLKLLSSYRKLCAWVLVIGRSHPWDQAKSAGITFYGRDCPLFPYRDPVFEATSYISFLQP